MQVTSWHSELAELSSPSPGSPPGSPPGSHAAVVRAQALEACATALARLAALLPVLQVLRHPALRERHGAAIVALMDSVSEDPHEEGASIWMAQEAEPPPTGPERPNSLHEAVSGGLGGQVAALREVAARAEEEAGIEGAMGGMRGSLHGRSVPLGVHRQKPILLSVDLILDEAASPVPHPQP